MTTATGPPPTQKLFVERLEPVRFDVIQEKVENNNWLLVRGRFQLADTKNGNGRIYPRGLWEHVLQDSDVVWRLNNRGMLGIVEHPESGVTDLKEVSHIVTKLWLVGTEVLGEALVLDTPRGELIQKLFRAKVPVGISSRGRGTSTMRDGAEYVETDGFKFDTFDFVCTPSVAGAFPSLAEGLQGPYRMESSMDSKKAEILRLQVRAHEMKEQLSGADTKTLDRFTTELVENEAKINTLSSQAPSLKREADEALSVTLASRAAVSDARDHKYAETAPAFQAKVAAVLVPPPPAAASGNGTASAGSEILAETFQRLTYATQRLSELEGQLKAQQGFVPSAKFEAAKRLAAALVSTIRRHEKNLASLKSEAGKIRKDAASARALIEAFVSRNDEAKLVRRIREAMADNPRLASVESLLRKAKNLPELEEMIGVQVKAFNGSLKKSSAATDEKPKAKLEQRTCSGCGYVTEAEASLGDITCPECGKRKLTPTGKKQPAAEGKATPPQLAFESELPTERTAPPKKTEEKVPSSPERTGDPTVDLTHAVLRRIARVK